MKAVSENDNEVLIYKNLCWKQGWSSTKRRSGVLCVAKARTRAVWERVTLCQVQRGCSEREDTCKAVRRCREREEHGAAWERSWVFFVEEEGRLATGDYLLLFWFKKVDCLAARAGLSYCWIGYPNSINLPRGLKGSWGCECDGHGSFRAMDHCTPCPGALPPR